MSYKCLSNYWLFCSQQRPWLPPPPPSCWSGTPRVLKFAPWLWRGFWSLWSHRYFSLHLAFYSKGHCLVPFCITVTFRLGFRVGSRSFVTGRHWRLSKALRGVKFCRLDVCYPQRGGVRLRVVCWMEKSKVSKNGCVRNAQPHSKGLVISDNSGQTTVQT